MDKKLTAKEMEKTRVDAGLTVKEMAKRVGYSWRYYTYRENGDILPDLKFSNAFRWVQHLLKKKRK